MLDANHKLVKEAVARKKEEYRNNVEVIQISKMYELQKYWSTKEFLSKLCFFLFNASEI